MKRRWSIFAVPLFACTAAKPPTVAARPPGEVSPGIRLAPPPHIPQVASPRPALELALRFDFAPPLETSDPLSLWATNYFVPEVHSVADGHDLRDADGTPLGPKLSTYDWCNAALQGTVRVVDVGLFNYAGVTDEVEVDCVEVFPAFKAISRTRFRVADGPYGDSARGILVPFRTIAVDSARIPYGSVLFVPEAIGEAFVLPSGDQRVHDGFFFASDRGGAIKDTHIDVFTGNQKQSPLSLVRNKKTEPFEAFLVDDQHARRVLAAAHLFREVRTPADAADTSAPEQLP